MLEGGFEQNAPRPSRQHEDLERTMETQKAEAAPLDCRELWDRFCRTKQSRNTPQCNTHMKPPNTRQEKPNPNSGPDGQAHPPQVGRRM